MDPTDDTLDRGEQAYEEIDEKALLIEQCALLASIDRKLELLLGSESDSTPERYQCADCGDVVAAPDRDRHLRTTHGAPADVDPGRFFEAL